MPADDDAFLTLVTARLAGLRGTDAVLTGLTPDADTLRHALDRADTLPAAAVERATAGEDYSPP
ncbi:hypothetical protein ACL02R_17460 [Streptomyces sp. MS19]|uniref:hypothetical protein n=1 Tax=Streptomyces sp. MS19 TaxID=3385972 RepID=UPI0039A37A47